MGVKSNKNGRKSLVKHEVYSTFGREFNKFFVTATVDELLQLYRTNVLGLSTSEAVNRKKFFGPNEIAKKKKTKFEKVAEKFKNPLVVVLLIVAVVSLYMDEVASAVIVTVMALSSVLLSYYQEEKASKESEKLIEMVRIKATVYRDNQLVEIPIKDIVPGDIVYLSAGDIIPADLRIISCKDLFINQSSITGESYPVEKFSTPIHTAEDYGSTYSNIAFMGTSVVSGSGLGLVLLTGEKTQFGMLSKRVSESTAKTAFEEGISKFSYMVVRITFFLVLTIFLINALTKGDPLQAFLFSLAVAVGLTPEMLPLIITVNLAKGSLSMAAKKVIVKRLSSIQNFGSMDVLCTDKTGTLTVGEVVLEKYIDVEGNDDAEVLIYGYINSYYQTGLKNLLDKAILKHGVSQIENTRKIDEIPFDFVRKLMSVVVEYEGKHVLIAKGAPEEILKRCNFYVIGGNIYPLEEQKVHSFNLLCEKLTNEGLRVLAVAYKEFDIFRERYTKQDEKDLILKGFMIFLDPPKRSAKATIAELNKLGIELKILTGDSETVTVNICARMKVKCKGVITGEQLAKMSEHEIAKAVEENTIFARLTPLQKELIISVLKKNGHVVGYMGDGINDAPALKAADVGISVNNAVDIAKESADIILLKKSLRVLRDGVVEGRTVFGNIIKYIRMAASSNFGNMFSVTGASIILPFLPMTSIQILVNNFLYDLSQLAIPADSVDEELVKKPTPWNMKNLERFIVIMGPVSSIFDFITFGVLIYYSVPVHLFHTLWFIESLATQTFAIHVIRTSKIPFLQSRPAKALIVTSFLIVAFGLFLILSPLGGYLGFALPPVELLIIMFFIVLFYLITLQIAKQYYIKIYGYY